MKRNRKQCENANEAFRPFEKLRDMLDGRSLKIGTVDSFFHAEPQTGHCRKEEKETPEQELFQNAMADVTPIDTAKCCGIAPKKCRMHLKGGANRSTSETNVVAQLARLVDCGDGFEVSHTPEYMEGRGYNVSREITRRLYNGDFSIQEHIDLHGLNAIDAREAFLAFMQRAISNGTRAVLIVHGRGLSSPGKPVLKRALYSWLTHSFIRKWVIAFTSARSCDGGAGATYVLLRLRPVTKRFRKNARKNAEKRIN